MFSGKRSYGTCLRGRAAVVVAAAVLLVSACSGSATSNTDAQQDNEDDQLIQSDIDADAVEIPASEVVGDDGLAPQRAAIDDGALEFAEYERFVHDYRRCFEDLGFEFVLFELDAVSLIYEWGVPSPALAADGVCYQRHLSIVDPSWQLLQTQRQRELGINPLRAKRIRCHIIHGMEYENDWSDGQLSINLLEAGIDILTCGE